MCVWLNLKTIKFYLIKFATDFYQQPSNLLGERASLDIYTSSLSALLDHPVIYTPGMVGKVSGYVL